MATVDRNIYPIVSQDENLILSQTANNLSYNVDWDSSIAISQSTRANAPFNLITVVAHDSSTQYKSVITKSVQKIALYFPTSTYDGNFLSSYGQYRNEYIDGVAFADETDYSALAATRRSPVSGSWWEDKISRIQRDRGHYQLVSGINVQKILGVICCGFRDGRYCSLSYYNSHKNSLTTPTCLFMRILTSEDRDMFVIDTEVRQFRLFEATSGGVVERNWFSPVSDMLPPYMGFQYDTIESTSANSPYKKGTSGFPTLISPLMACAMGGRFTTVDTFNSGSWSDMDKAHGHAIFGGELNVDYTLVAENGYYYPVLTQNGLSQALAIAATYGIPFTTEFPDTWATLYSSNINTYMPVANDGGYFDGAYETLTVNGVVSGDMTPESEITWYGGVNAPYDDRNYDPDIPIPVDDIDLIQPNLTAIDAFNRTYIISKNDVDTLGRAFWSANTSILDKIEKAWELFGEKPINGVINIMLFPFDVRSKTGATTEEYITIGEYDTGIYAYRLPQTAHARYSLGSFTWREKFDGSFLDYTPYTEAELYVPFFGVFPLPNEHFLGKTISIDLVVDFITGAATCIIFVTEGNKRHPVIYKNATIGIQVPVSGDDVNQRINAMLDNSLSIADSMIDMGKGAAEAITGNVVSGAKQAGKAALSLASPNFSPSTMYQSAGSSTPECSLYLPKKPYLILYYPKLINVDDYGHLIGYATMEEGFVRDFSGFTVFTNIDMTGVPATQQEKEMIQALLNGGVFV